VKRNSNLSPALKLLIPLLLIGAAVAAYWAVTRMRKTGESAYRGAVFPARNQEMVISVTERGTLESNNATEITCQVEGRNEIVSLVPDGSIVKKGQLLVQLDDSDLKEREAQQSITCQSASADYIQAKESYAIQQNQNDSNIKAGELDVQFARMDFERYLGVKLAQNILDGKVKLSQLSLGDMEPDKAAEALDKLGLGGAARKEWQKLQSDIDLADEKVKRAYSDYLWSRKLGPANDDNPDGKGYISQSDVEADKLQWQAAQAEAAQAKLAKNLFLRYDLPKEAQKLHSDYREAERELQRIHAKARAELAQAESKLKSKEAALKLQTARLQKLRDQIAKCAIRAPRAGMIVYASTTNRWGREQDIIEEGAQVRFRQVLIRMPDPTSMALKVKIDETVIDQIKPGLKVNVTADSFPGMVMIGTVKKVASTPDPQLRWMSTDTNTYTTLVTLDNPPKKLKPGMSAKAEIIIDRLENPLVVPVQAVFMLKGLRVCYVLKSSKPEARPVEIGHSNNDFIEILSGLTLGEKVLLARPVNADETRVAQLAAERQAKAAERIKLAARESRKAVAELATAKQPAPATAEEDKVPAYIEKLPEQFRDRILERRRAIPQEKREEFDQKMRAMIRQRGDQQRPPQRDQ